MMTKDQDLLPPFYFYSFLLLTSATPLPRSSLSTRDSFHPFTFIATCCFLMPPPRSKQDVACKHGTDHTAVRM